MKKIIFIIPILFIFCFTAISVANEYESPSNRKASKILPEELLKGPHHEINETVISDGYMNTFNVKSDFGNFEVTGNLALYKLINEINAIARLEEVKKSDAFAEALKNSAKSPVKFAQNMIENPADTITGVPKGVFSMVGNIKTSLFSKKDPSTDSSIEELASVSKCKREYAKSVQVDVYSSNAELQKVLNSLGWACAAGGLSLSVATIPIGSPVVTLAKTAKIAQDVSDAIYNLPPSKLRQMNEKRLSEAGIDADIIKLFLDNPLYSPTQDTIISVALSNLKGTKNLGTYLEFASTSVETEEDAYFITVMTYLLVEYYEHNSKITDLQSAGIFIVAKDSRGNYMVPFPLDYGVWSEMADKRISELTKQLNLKKGKKLEFWVTGTVSPLAESNLKSKGIKLVDDIKVNLKNNQS